jgi:hypothetical protein
VLHPGNACLQTTTALQESIKAIEALGGGGGDGVRVRLFVRNEGEGDCDEVGRAMKDVLGEGAPWTATMIVGVAFVRREILMEI